MEMDLKEKEGADRMEEKRHWAESKESVFALIFAIAVQTGTIIWWASSVENRVMEMMKSDDAQNAEINQVETTVQSMQVGAATFATQISGLADSLAEVKQGQHETNDLLRQLIQGKLKP